MLVLVSFPDTSCFEPQEIAGQGGVIVVQSELEIIRAESERL